MVNFKGKTAVITGGGSGIGLGFAHALAAKGANLVLIGRRLGLVEAAAKQIGETFGVRATAYSVDVSNAEAIEQMAEKVFEHFGAVHILANNAAVSTAGFSWETSLSDWQNVLNTNLMGAVHGIRSFVPKMISSNEEGYIVNVSSMGGLLPVPMKAPYTAAKHGMIGMAKALYAELQSKSCNIGVSVVCPGPVATDMIDAQIRKYENDPNFSKEQRAVLEKLKKDVDSGMPADTAGKLMLGAIEKKQFWLFLNAQEYYSALNNQFAQIKAAQ